MDGGERGKRPGSLSVVIGFIWIGEKGGEGWTCFPW